jgi:phosphatidylinositol-bisphosphatase
MADWLMPPLDGQKADVYSIGFEEIVDLTAQNMVATAQTHRQEWADELSRVLGSEFSLVTSVQLVGVCLFIFVRNDHLHGVKEVVTDQVKTGAGGRVGNKGGVAVRFRLYNSPVCFVCAHLAAGQSHTAERDADYNEITKRLAFGKGRTLASHDFIFWCVCVCVCVILVAKF